MAESPQLSPSFCEPPALSECNGCSYPFVRKHRLALAKPPTMIVHESGQMCRTAPPTARWSAKSCPADRETSAFKSESGARWRPILLGWTCWVEVRKWLRGLDLNQRPLGYENARQSLSAVESITQRRKTSCKNRFCQPKCSVSRGIEKAKVCRLIRSPPYSSLLSVGPGRPSLLGGAAALENALHLHRRPLAAPWGWCPV